MDWKGGWLVWEESDGSVDLFDGDCEGICMLWC